MFEHLVYWHWLALALIFWGLEMAVPGAAMLWIGAAAAAVGVLVFFVPDMHWSWQVIAFSIASLIAVVVTFVRKAGTTRVIATDDPDLNKRAARYLGQTVTLAEPILNGRGRAQVGDSTWSVTGPDLPAGAAVKIIGADGAVLKVEKAN